MPFADVLRSLVSRDRPHFGWHALSSMRRAWLSVTCPPRPSKTQGVPPRLRSLSTDRKWLVAMALAGITFVVFIPALSCGFVNLDDPDYVIQNPYVRDGLSAERVAWAFTAVHSANWHPLTWLSLQLDASLWWPKYPMGFHLTSVLIHSVNAALLFLALEALMGSFWRSAVVALLFAVHPLRVESVAWVSERKDVLSTFFGLVALWAYAGYAHRRRAGLYGLVIIAFLLSLLSKSMLVTLPLLLLVLDWWPLGRVQKASDWMNLALEKLPLLGVAILVSGYTIWTQHSQGGTGGTALFSLETRLGNAVVSYLAYLGKTFCPINLAAFYPYPTEGFVAGIVFVAFAVLAAISAVAVLSRRRAPYLLAGWLWYLGTLVPVIGLVQVGGQAYADRYTYFPQIGILVAVCWGVADLARGRVRTALAFAAGTALVAACLTWNQEGVWKNSIALWEHAVRVTRADQVALNFLGQSYQQENRDDEAAEYFTKACEVAPHSSYGYTNLGKVRMRQGRYDEAARLFEKAIVLPPPQSDAFVDLGDIAQRRGDFARAADYFRKGAQLAPESADAHKGLGFTLARLGRRDEAIAELRTALRYDPQSIPTYVNLAAALEARGDLEGAAMQLTIATSLSPTAPSLYLGLGVLRMRQHRYAEAVQYFQGALKLDPSSTKAKTALEMARKAADGRGAAGATDAPGSR
jgi:protein O-mannosyl-transferase